LRLVGHRVGHLVGCGNATVGRPRPDRSL